MSPNPSTRGHAHFRWLEDSFAPVSHGERHLQGSTQWDRQALSPKPLKRFVLDSGIGGLQNHHLSPTGPLQLPYRKAREGGLGLPSGPLTLSSQGLHTSLGRTLCPSTMVTFLDFVLLLNFLEFTGEPGFCS